MGDIQRIHDVDSQCGPHPLLHVLHGVCPSCHLPGNANSSRRLVWSLPEW
jgi:hypothetical protein